MVVTMVAIKSVFSSAVQLLTQHISASQFKARCLALMDQVAATGEELVITKNGRPVAELHPCRPSRRPSPFGLHPRVEIHGDVISPRDESWDVLQ